MTHKHEPEIPAGLEMLVTRLGELEIVLGTQIAPLLQEVRSTLRTAMAARDGGDLPAALERIGHAMDRLSTLADQLDPAEGALMRALAQSFRSALLRGDHTQVKQSTAVMLHKSGALERKRH